MIKNFDKQNLGTLRKEIDDALGAVAKKHGITLSIGNIRYSGSEMRTKLTGNIIDGTKANGEVGRDPSESKWVRNLDDFTAHMAGFSAKMAGTVFTLRGDQYVLVGFRPKAKHRVVGKKPGNKTYVALPEDEVAAAMGLTA